MSDLKKTKKETIVALVEKFPEVSKIRIGYQGGGDNFDSFYDFSIYDLDNKEIVSSQFDENTFLNIADDYIWYIFNNAQSQPDFNNDGSEGTVTFDLINRAVILEVTYLEDVTPEYDGDENADDYDEKRDEYWDNMDERDIEHHPQKPEVF